MQPILISSDEENIYTEPIIISIDVGFKNLGVIVYNPNTCRVLVWEAKSLNLTKFTTNSVIESVKGFIDIYLGMTDVVKNKCTFVIERQSQMVVVRKVVLVDMAMRAYLTGKGINIITITPANVKRYFDIQSKSYKRRKTLAVNKVLGMFSEDLPFVIDDKTKNVFLTSRKKDDFADCYLQFMYYVYTFNKLR
jgi:hypothetical protein